MTKMMDFRRKPPASVYIHIPFCAKKCFYCDFNTYVLDGQPVDDYLDALEAEMERTVRQAPPDVIETVFIGGGTPTVLTAGQLERLLAMVKAYFPRMAPDAEITMEANPGTVDREKLAAMREGGVNRLSLGVQTFHDGLLEKIGRIHRADDVHESLENARQAGFANISIDLMFGLPNQTVEMLEQSLDIALGLGLQHYSIYGLKVEENTLFHVWYEKNELPLPSEDEEVLMYQTIIRKLEAAGYRHYEISNFALPGFEGRHNTAYWLNRSYYGFGAGAHGYVHGVRHVNIKGVQPYINAARSGFPRLEQAEVSREEAMEDYMMVGFRLLDGLSRAGFEEQFGVTMESVFGPVLDRLLRQGLIERVGEEGYRLSRHALMLANEVFGAFVGYLANES